MSTHISRGRDSFQQPLISPSAAGNNNTSFIDTTTSPSTLRAPYSSHSQFPRAMNSTSPRTGSPSTPYSKRLILSYLLDWVIIAVLVVVGGFLQLVRPNHRPFTLLSLDNSFPLLTETVPIWLAAVLAVAVPALVILIVALVFVPGFSVVRRMDRKRMWKLKLWELERGIAGLALSLAGAFFITQCLKNLFGKPRPNMLARCQPNLDDIARFAVGGYGQDISPRWTLVSHEICTSTDLDVLDDGFRSFPSGHSSVSWAGLLYLTLFLCSKFNIAIPSLPAVWSPRRSENQSLQQEQEMMPLQQNGQSSGAPKDSVTFEGETAYTGYQPDMAHRNPAHPFQIRHLAASPPNHLLILAFTPVGIAVWIGATRYSDFYHFGFDIIFGSLIGIFTAWFSFRWYHLPLSRGHGWAWGARSLDRAFGIGVGTDGYVGDIGARKRNDDGRRDMV